MLVIEVAKIGEPKVTFPASLHWRENGLQCDCLAFDLLWFAGICYLMDDLFDLRQRGIESCVDVL